MYKTIQMNNTKKRLKLLLGGLKIKNPLQIIPSKILAGTKNGLVWE